MALFGFTVATVIATFVLLLVGGTVNPTGSSLACPDWPTCYGTFFPVMKDGVEFEHTHRLVATLVGLMTLVLAGWIWSARKQDTKLRSLGVAAAVLVVIQGLLGGITVLLKLPLLVSTAHLAVSMLFFLLLIYLTLRLQPGYAAAPQPRSGQPPLPRLWVGLTTLLVYLQIVLGAFVRHTKSGRACGDDYMLCVGSLWPSWAPAQLHMLHRFVGILVFFAVVALALFTLRRSDSLLPRIPRFALMLAVGLVSLQLSLGFLTVATGINLVIVTAHLGGGALLVATLFVAFLSMPAHQRAPHINHAATPALETAT